MSEFPAWQVIQIGGETAGELCQRWIHLGGVIFPPLADNLAEEQPILIAAKNDRIWSQLGASMIWPDGLDIDHPPFYRNSGAVWIPVSQSEAVAYGVIDYGHSNEQLQAITERVIQFKIKSRNRLDAAIRKRQEENAKGPNLDELIAMERERYKSISEE